MTVSLKPKSLPLHSVSTLQFGPIEKSYVQHEELGSGGSGTAYRVSKIRNSFVSYAAKIFHKTPEAIGQMEHEKQNLIKSKGAPHTTQLYHYDADFSQNTAALVTTLASGSPLLKHIYKNTITIESIAQTVQILEFLAHIHSLECIYFDLKPENVIFNSEENEMTVIDLGSMYSISGEIPSFMGTAFYRPLSIWLEGPYDTSIDMWAFGLLLFELFTSHPLIWDNNEDNYPLDSFEYVNRYVNHIVSQCGMPPACFLDKHNNTSRFFSKKGKDYVLKNPVEPTLAPWKDRMRLFKRKVPDYKLNRLIDLIEKCLRYENPFTAQEALSHCFFTQAITHFSIELSHPMLSNYTLSLLSQRESTHIPLMKINLAKKEKLACLHAAKPLKEEFIVDLRVTGTTKKLLGPCRIGINNHDKLIIEKNNFGKWVFSKKVERKSKEREVQFIRDMIESVKAAEHLS